MQKSDYVFVGWVVAILIVAILTIVIPAWRDWLGLLLLKIYEFMLVLMAGILCWLFEPVFGKIEFPDR